MEPYQRSAESIRSGEESYVSLLKNVGLTAIGTAGATLGSAAISRLIPAVGALINNYVPENLSKAGLSKIDPRFGKFIQGAIDEGYSYEDVRKFLGEKIEKSQPAKENKNIIEQYSPELHRFILEEIQKGRKPMEAGALAQNDKKFSSVIKKLSGDHKTNWSDILQSVYGRGEMAQSGSIQEQSKAALQQEQQQPQQTGQGQQALMGILQRINQRLGGMQ